MLSKSQRLNLKKEFKWVASGKKIESKYLKIFFKTGDNQLPRIGIAVSSKSFKNSTGRNRAKRLVSQAFQSTYYQLPTTINIAALPKAGVIKVKSDEVVKDLAEVLKAERIID